MNETQTFLDVNAASGALRQVFAMDITMAMGQCNHCAQTGPLAEAYVYAMEPGLIVRCTNCEGVLMRVVSGEGRTWLDLRGMTYMQLPTNLAQ